MQRETVVARDELKGLLSKGLLSKGLLMLVQTPQGLVDGVIGHRVFVYTGDLAAKTDDASAA